MRGVGIQALVHSDLQVPTQALKSIRNKKKTRVQNKLAAWACFARCAGKTCSEMHTACNNEHVRGFWVLAFEHFGFWRAHEQAKKFKHLHADLGAAVETVGPSTPVEPVVVEEMVEVNGFAFTALLHMYKYIFMYICIGIYVGQHACASTRVCVCIYI